MKYLFFTTAFFVFIQASSQITMERADDGILIKDGSTDILFYQSVPKSKDGQYTRTNYIHPLWGIDGNILTEDFPTDHLHQRGIFWAWHQIFVDGQRLGDGWELKNYNQEVVELEFLVNTKKQGILKTEVLWKSPVWKGGEEPYLRENAAITVYPLVANYRRIDFDIRLTPLEDGFELGGSEDEKGYSGFSTRVILPEGVKFIGRNGVVKPETNAVTAGSYIAVEGAYGKNGGNGGIVIVQDPIDPGYPQPWILRESKSMQNVAWPGRKPVAVPKDKPLELKYTILIYKGKMPVKAVRRLF